MGGSAWFPLGKSREDPLSRALASRPSPPTPHRDGARRAKDRIFGVVANVAQDVDEGWPLYIEAVDASGKPFDEPEYHEVFLQPGTMVLYEAARLTHGRARRLRGRSYTNAFIHFKPAG